MSINQSTYQAPFCISHIALLNMSLSLKICFLTMLSSYKYGNQRRCDLIFTTITNKLQQIQCNVIKHLNSQARNLFVNYHYHFLY